MNTSTFCTSTKHSLLCDTFDLFSCIFNGFLGKEEVFWLRKGKRREGAPKSALEKSGDCVVKIMFNTNYC